jgi:hypothetical protein
VTHTFISLQLANLTMGCVCNFLLQSEVGNIANVACVPVWHSYMMELQKIMADPNCGGSQFKFQNMRGIHKVWAIYYFSLKKGTQEQIYCHILIQSPSFSIHLLLQSKSFLMPSAQKVFHCRYSHICITSLTSSSFANQCPSNAPLSSLKI